MMVKIIIAGGRDFQDKELLNKVMSNKLKEYDTSEIQIVSGAAKGADQLGADWADKNNIDVIFFPADWKNLKAEPCFVHVNAYGKYNKLAGFNRNKAMAEYADELIAFWNGKKAGSGTFHMITLAKQKGLKLVVVDYKGNHYASDQY